MSTNITFVRHAIYHSDLEEFSSRRYAHLSPTGKLDAAALADSLSERNFSTIYSSPYVRALETAENFRNFSSSPSMSGIILVNELLEERDFGDLDGKVLPYDDYIRLWQTDSPDFSEQLGVESLASLEARAEKFLQTVAETHIRENVIAFTHSGFILAVYSVLFGTPESKNLLSFPILDYCEHRTFTIKLC